MREFVPNPPDIPWSRQHCGVHQAPFKVVLELMPDLEDILDTFPDNAEEYTWDVKVHMLMPGQYPCVPNWHCDNVPRVGGIQRFDRVLFDRFMWLWLSGGPLTQFKHGFVQPRTWVRFSQIDEHRGLPADSFGWRGFIRATHQAIQAPKGSDYLRRHSQVYVNAETYQW